MMRRKRNQHLVATGRPPGTVVHLGERKTDVVGIHIIDYNQDRINEQAPASVDECRDYLSTDTVTWINIDGLHDTRVIEEIGRLFDVHPLVLEDIGNTSQRPKAEVYNSDFAFIVVRMLRYEVNGADRTPTSEQVSIIMGPGFVISFQEQPGDVFEPVRDRLRTAKGRIRGMGADYLAYSLLDAVIDGYFSVLEYLGDEIEPIEERIVQGSSEDAVRALHALKRRLIEIRHAVWPLRELTSTLIRDESGLIEASLGPFLHDAYDHVVQVVDTVESYRDIVSGLVDLYMSSVSNRMNQVMKVLTIIATIFIPLTFVAGIYGMNFNPEASPFNMPELNWTWGYPAALGVMILITVGMIIYFKRKKWL